MRYSVWAAGMTVGMMMATGLADASAAAQGTVASVTTREEAARGDRRAAREALRAADRAHAAAADARGYVDGLTLPLADDAFLLRDGAPLLQGREAIRTDLAASALAAARLNWTALRMDVSTDGMHGYTYGGGVHTRADGTTAFTRTISYWRNDGGTWKVAAMLVNLTDREAVPPPDGFFPGDGSGFGGESPAGAAELDGMMQADRDFAALATAQNPAIAFRDFMAPDGATLDGPVYGPAANYELQKDGRGRLEWGPIHASLAPSGDLGFTIGEATAINPDTGERRYSKYLSIWRRQPDGSWRYVMDSGNARPAPAS